VIYAYHRLARSFPKYAWWKPLLTALIGAAIYLALSIAWGIVFVALAFLLPDAFPDFLARLTSLDLDLADPATFAFAIGSIALMLPAVFLATLIMGPRPVGLLSSVAGRLRWRWLARCIVPALGVYIVVFGLSFFLPLPAGEAVAPAVTSTTVILVVLALVLTPLQATAEEYVFRGYLAQAIGGWLRHPAFAILLPVPLFTIGHDYDVWGLADVAIFAVFAGWLTWRTGGLEAAIVAHVVNNTTLFVLGAFGLADLNADSGSALALGTTLVIMVAYSALVLREAKRTGLMPVREVAPPQPVLAAGAPDPRAEGTFPTVGSPTLGA